MSMVTLTKVVTLTARDCMSSRTVITALPSLLDYCWLTHYNSSTSRGKGKIVIPLCLCM